MVQHVLRHACTNARAPGWLAACLCSSGILSASPPSVSLQPLLPPGVQTGIRLSPFGGFLDAVESHPYAAVVYLLEELNK